MANITVSVKILATSIAISVELGVFIIKDHTSWLTYILPVLLLKYLRIFLLLLLLVHVSTEGIFLTTHITLAVALLAVPASHR